MKIRELISRIPEVGWPKEGLSTKDRVKWTLTIAVLFLVLSLMPLPVDMGDTYYSHMLYSNIMTLTLLGIGPIVTIIFLLQVLLRLNIIRLDLGKSEDRRLFYGAQKILILFLAIFEGLSVVLGLGLSSTLVGALPLVAVLAFGVLVLLYMDEVVVKWGLGSGLALFISVAFMKELFYGLFNPMPDASGNVYSLLPSIIDSYVNMGVLDFGMIFQLLILALIFAAIVFGFRRRIEFPVSTKTVSGKYSMKYLYVSTDALGSIGFAALFSLTPSIIYGALSPEKVYALSDPAIMVNVGLYSVILLVYSLLLGYVFGRLQGLDLLYMKQSPHAEINVDGGDQALKNKMISMIIISSLVIGALSVADHLSGMWFSVGLMLIFVGYLFRCLEETRGPKKMCPNCSSKDIEWLLPSLWSMWECRRCGYRGTIVIDVEEAKV